MPFGKDGLRASVIRKNLAFGLGCCLLSPSGRVFTPHAGAWSNHIICFALQCSMLLWLRHQFVWFRLTHLPIFCRVTSLERGQSYDCHNTSEVTIVSSGNGLLPVLCQAITWTNAGPLSVGLVGKKNSEIGIGILPFLFKKIHLKTSSAKMVANLSSG